MQTSNDSGPAAAAESDQGGKNDVFSSSYKSKPGIGAASAAASPAASPAAAPSPAAAAVPTTSSTSFTTAVTASQLAEEYVKLLDAVGTPNYETIQSLFAGYGCPPASTIPAIQVSFELFEAVQNRFAATKQVLERTKAELLNRNQQFTVVHQDLHRLQEEYAALSKRNTEAEERNTELHQQRAKLEVSVEQLRREVGQGRTALDTLRNKLARQEEELQRSQSRVAENLVALSQKDAVVNTLRRELLKRGSLAYGGVGGRRNRRVTTLHSGAVEDGAEDAERALVDGNDGEGASVDAADNAEGAAMQDAYTADMLGNIAADVEDRAQEARMKLNVADLEGRLARLQEEKDSVLTQHTQYRQHVQLALQSYEAAAMLREDAMGSHVCLRTPYFAGEQQTTYETVINIQTGERLSAAADPAPANEDGERRTSTNASNASATATTAASLPNFTALTFELKRIMDRFAKVHIDDSSSLRDGLSRCVAAERRALQAGADLIGFLSTMEEEVLRRRLTLPEVREEWRKACVPEFAQAVAAALRESTSELGKGLVGLLERENAFVAEIEAIKAQQQQQQRASLMTTDSNNNNNSVVATAAAAAAAASVPGTNDAVDVKRAKKRSSAQGGNDAVNAAAEHVNVGITARLSEKGQDVAVQVDASELTGTGGHAKTAAAPTPLPEASSGPASPPSPPPSASLEVPTQHPTLTPTPPTQTRGALPAGSATCGPLNSAGKAATTAAAAGQTPVAKQPSTPCVASAAQQEKAEKNNKGSNASLQEDAPSTQSPVPPATSSPHPQTLFPPETDRTVQPNTENDNRPSPEVPLVLSGVCPHCAHAVTLTSDAAAAQLGTLPASSPSPEATATPAIHATTTPHHKSISPQQELKQQQQQQQQQQVPGSRNLAASSSQPMSLSSSDRLPDVSQPVVVPPNVCQVPAGETVTTGGAAAAVARSVPEKRSTEAAGPAVRPNLGLGADPDGAVANTSDSGSAAPPHQDSAVNVELLHTYQQRLTATEASLAEVQATNAELRTQLAAALAAAAKSDRDGHVKHDFGERAPARLPVTAKQQQKEDYESHATQKSLSSPPSQQPQPMTPSRQHFPSGTASATPSCGTPTEDKLSVPQCTPAAAAQQATPTVGAAANVLPLTPAASAGASSGAEPLKDRGANAAHDTHARATSASSQRTAAAVAGSAGQTTHVEAVPAAAAVADGDADAGLAVSFASQINNDNNDKVCHSSSSSSSTLQSSTSGGDGGGGCTRPAHVRNADARVNSGGDGGRHTSCPPPLPRIGSSHLSSPSSAVTLHLPAEFSDQQREQQQQQRPAALHAFDSAADDSSFDYPVKGSQHTTPSILVPSSRRFVEDDLINTAGTTTSAAVVAPSLVHNGIVGHGLQTSSTAMQGSKQVLKPLILGYSVSSMHRGGPSSSSNLDLCITGSRPQPGPTPTARGVTADHSSAASSQLLHRSHMSFGSNSSKAAAASSSSKQNTMSKSVKRATATPTATAAAGAGGFCKQKQWTSREPSAKTQATSPLSPAFADPPPRLPPVKVAAGPGAPDATALSATAAVTLATAGLPSAYSSAVPLRHALPAICINDIPSHSPSQSGTAAVKSSAGATTPVVPAQAEGVRADDTPWEPSQPGSERVRPDNEHSASAGLSEKGSYRNMSGTAPVTTGPTPTPPPNSAQMQSILHALLSPAPRRLSTVAEAAPLSTQHERQLLYQVLRLRSTPSVGLRRGNAVRAWQQRRGQRTYSVLRINGTAMAATGMAKAGGGNTTTAPTGDAAAAAVAASQADASSSAVLLHVPSGCILRPFILRRVHRPRLVGSRRTTALAATVPDAAAVSRSFGAGDDETDVEYLRDSPPKTALPHHQTCSGAADASSSCPAYAYGYYLSTPAEVPRQWSTGRPSFLGGGLMLGRGPRLSRTWQQQRRYEHAQRWRQRQRAAAAHGDPLAIHGLHVASGAAATTTTTTTGAVATALLSPRVCSPQPARTFPPFTAQLAAREPAVSFPPFLFSPFPCFASTGISVGSRSNNINTTSSAVSAAASLQPTVSPMHIYQRPLRQSSRARLRLLAKRDPVRRAVKRNVYIAAAPTPPLPSYFTA